MFSERQIDEPVVPTEADAIRNRLVSAAKKETISRLTILGHHGRLESEELKKAEAELAAAITAFDEWMRAALVRAFDAGMEELIACSAEDAT